MKDDDRRQRNGRQCPQFPVSDMQDTRLGQGLNPIRELPRGNRLRTGILNQHPAVNRQRSQRDHDGRHTTVGHEETVHHPHERPDAHHQGHRQQRVEVPVESELLAQEEGCEANHRPD